MKRKSTITNKNNFIKLDKNESYFFLDKKILNEINKFDSSIISRYPEYNEIKKLLASHCGLKQEKIILTNGADQAIWLIIQTFFKERDEVLLPVPTFIAITSALRFVDIKSKIIFYKEDGNKFVFPLTEVLFSINRKTKGIILCNPNNPLGSSITKKEISLILNRAKQFKIPVIIDEVYSEFSSYSSVKLTEKYKNLIIIKSFSKEFAMAGLRLGYIIANQDIVKRLEEKRGLPWSVNHFAIYTAKILLRRMDYFRKKIKEVLIRKKDLISFLRKQGIKCRDTDTNFIIIKSSNHRKLIQDLKSKGILVSDVSKYDFGQKLLKGTIRMSVPSKTDIRRVKMAFEKKPESLIS